jgi:hypothetical protein
MCGVVIEVFPFEGGRFVVEFEKHDLCVRVGCTAVFKKKSTAPPPIHVTVHHDKFPCNKN